MISTDWMEIRALLERAEFGLDYGEPDDYASAFSENGVLVTPSKTAHSRAGILTAIEAMQGFMRSKREYLGPTRIDIEGDSAQAVTKWWVIDLANDNRIWATGVYRDTLTRTAEGWKIIERRHVPDER